MKLISTASKRIKALLFCMGLFMAVFVSQVSAQVDTVFWFAVPYVNVHHGLNTPNYTNINPADNFIGGGRPIYLKVSTLGQPATVTVSVPAKNYTIYSLTIPANSTQTFDLTKYADSIIVSKKGNVIENKGLLVHSTALVTAYYENATIQNPDLFALKGSNALGTEFYTPFQTLWPNDPRHNANWDDPIERYWNSGISFFVPPASEIWVPSTVHNREGYVYRPGVWPAYDPITYPDSVLTVDSAFSAFDIVATEDNTSITITPATDIVGHKKNIPFTIILHRGQTYSARAVGQGVLEVVEKTGVKTWRSDKDTVNVIIDNKDTVNLSGSHIVASKKIAVTIKDDSVSPNDELGTYSGGSEDFNGDQLVPIDLIGSEYLVMRGNLDPKRTKEHVFILAVEDGTVITAGDSTYTLNKGQTQAHSLCTGSTTSSCQDFVHIQSQNGVPFYVYHISGYEAESAGAILPPISECTGSSQIGFTRTYGGSGSPDNDTRAQERFFMNLLVRSEGAVDRSAFEIYTNGVLDWNATNVIQKANFTPLVGSPWHFLRVEFNESQLSNGAHLLKNSKELFHMAFVNSTAYKWGDTPPTLTGALYGYFSKFNKAVPNASVFLPKTQFDDTVYVNPGQPFSFIADGGVSYKWSAEKYDSTSVASNKWISIDASKILSSLTEYNPSSSGIVAEGAYRFPVDIVNSCYPGAADTLYVFVANFIPPYQITDTVCDIDDAPDVYLSQFYDLNHLNDTIISAKADSMGYKITGWYEAVAGGMLTLQDFDGTSLLGVGVVTNGTIANGVNSDKTGNPSATAAHLIKTSNVGADIAKKRTVSITYPFNEVIDLSEGYKFSFLLRYDDSPLAAPSNKTNNKLFVELISPDGTVKSSEMTIADAFITNPQWMEQSFSFAKDSLKAGFTDIRISIVSTFDHTQDYGFFIDNIKRDVRNHYKKIENDTAYVFTNYYNTIIAKYEGSGRFVMDTNYVFVLPTGRQTHHVVKAPMCRLETDSLCGIDLRDLKYSIGGALVGKKWWYRSISETVDTIIYKDSIADITNVCVMGMDTLYAHVQDRCYKYGSLIFDVVPTAEYNFKKQTITLCGDQKLDGKTAYVDLKSYESAYFKNSTYTWDVKWYSSDVFLPENLINDPSRVTVANSDILYGEVNALGKTLCPETVELHFVVREMPLFVFPDQEHCDDAPSQTLTATPLGGTFSINGVPATEFNPKDFAGTQVEIVYSVENESCPWTDTAVFTVHNSPVASVSPIDVLTFGSTTILDATVLPLTGSYSYLWSLTGTTDNTIIDPTVEDVVTGKMYESEIFTLIVTDNLTGCDDTLSVNVPVQPNPVKVLVIPSTDPLCHSRSQELVAKISFGIGPFSLQWSTGEIRASSMVKSASIIISPDDTKEYSVTVTDHGDRDFVAENSATVIVFKNPTINAALKAADLRVCQNTPFSIDGSVTGGTGVITYQWSGIDVALLSPLTSSNPSFDSHTTPKVYSFQYIVTDEKTCSDTADIEVAVLTLPVLGLNPSYAVCSGHDLTLTSASTSGTVPYTYVWSGDVSYLNSVSEENVIFNRSSDVLATSSLMVKVSDANTCADSLDITITINPLPVPVITGSDKGVCKLETIDLSAQPASASYSYVWKTNSTTIGTDSELTFDITDVATDIPLKLLVTDIATGCSDSISTLVQVHELPSVSVSNAGLNKVCVGADITLEALATTVGGGSLSYVWSPATNISPLDTRVVDFTSASVADVNVSVTVTDERLCQNVASDVVSVLGRPIYTKPAVTRICTLLDYDFDLQTPSGSTVSWSGDVSVLKNNPAGANPRFYATDAGVYALTYTVSDGFCESLDSIVLTVDLRPEVSVVDYEACQSVDHTLSATLSKRTELLSVSYKWSENNKALSSTIKDLSYTSAVLGAHEVQVIATADNTCADTAVFTVNINANPTVSIVSNLAPRSGNRVPYNMDLKLSTKVSNGMPDYIYKWTSLGFLKPEDVTSKDITSPNFTSTSPVSYNIEVTDKNGCKATHTKDYYTVNPVNVVYHVDCNKDTIPFDIPQYKVPTCPECDASTTPKICNDSKIYSHDFGICEGEYVFIAPVISDFADPDMLTYTWYVDGVKMPWTEKNKRFIPSVIARNPLKQGDTITVLVEITNGYLSEPIIDKINIVVNPNPVPYLSVNLIDGGDSVLTNFGFISSVPTATPDDSLKYVWSGVLTSGLDSASLSKSSLLYYVSNDMKELYPSLTIEVEDIHGCTASATRGIHVISVSANSVCENTTASYIIHGIPEGSTLQLVEEPQDWTAVNDTLFTAFWPKAGDFTFAVYPTHSDPLILSIGSNVNQRVNAYPKIEINGLADVCLGATKPYEVVSSEPGIIKWSLEYDEELVNELTSTDLLHNSTVDINWNKIGTDIVSVTVDNSGCPSSDYMSVITHDNPVALFNYTPVDDVMIGTEIQFINSSVDTLQDSSYSYYWDFVGEGIYTSEAKNPLYQYQDLGVYPVSLIVYDKTWGCVDTVVVDVTVFPNPNCSMEYPNTIIVSHSNPDARVFHSFNKVGVLEEGYALKIFNQWGTPVWETTDINEKWDGYYNGSLVSQDVYAYQSTATCENGKVLKLNGDITVLR